ncbi:MAG: hypothetical protein WAO58_10820 [Fimbriimonadaceae bacterium]
MDEREKQLVRQWLDGWQELRAIQIAELRALTPADRWRIMATVQGGMHLFKAPRRSDLNESICARWSALRSTHDA